MRRAHTVGLDLAYWPRGRYLILLVDSIARSSLGIDFRNNSGDHTSTMTVYHLIGDDAAVERHILEGH